MDERRDEAAMGRRWRQAAGVLAGACLLLALLCGAGAAAVRAGAVAPPAFSLRAGPVGIEGGADRGHECPPHCEGQRPASGERIYSVWLVTPADAGERRHTWLLFAQPLR